MPDKIKVFMVDDSAVIRLALRKLLESDGSIEVIGYARDGKDALSQLKSIRPDVITLDVEMPIMNGIDTLKEIMNMPQPIPVIMVSSITKDGADVTLEALNLGAVDFITKPSTSFSTEINKIKVDLLEKIKAAVLAKPKKILSSTFTEPPIQKQKEIPKEDLKTYKVCQEGGKYKLVLIGISTGGPPALQEILPKFPSDFPVPIVVAQHMPPGFTKPMADRLDKLCPLKVDEAKEGDILKPGYIYIGKAGSHIKVKKKGAHIFLNITEEPKDTLYHPQVDIMFETASESLGGEVIAVVMTGMGSDGTEGLKKLKPKNAFVIAQDKETSAIYGMPRVAFESGLVDKVVPLQKIPEEIIKKFN